MIEMKHVEYSRYVKVVPHDEYPMDTEEDENGKLMEIVQRREMFLRHTLRQNVFINGYSREKIVKSKGKEETRNNKAL